MAECSALLWLQLYLTCESEKPGHKTGHKNHVWSELRLHKLARRLHTTGAAAEET